mmetsp:Transcript_14050/g.38816  ORF Transcript_14050/g.38816 Transcript_14050/m.38816 type:complete len:119 (+) Transcript_14050:894-1250(+)
MVDETPQGELLDERIYQVSGQFGFASDPQLQASLVTERGTLQDLLDIFKVTELMDLRRGLAVTSGLIPESQAEVDALLPRFQSKPNPTAFLIRFAVSPRFESCNSSKRWPQRRRCCRP